MKFLTKEILFGTVFAILLCVLGLINIGSLPGANYDELLFVNATQRIDETFIYKKYQEVPVMLMSYIGALKSYIYTPIFGLFGVSLESIRIPIFILGICSLGLLYLLLKRVFNRSHAILVTFIIGFNPHVLYQLRIDVGPVVLEFFFFICLLFMTYVYLNKDALSRTEKFLQVPFIYWLFFSIICLLGVFNKLHFIWIVNSFIFVHVAIFFLQHNVLKILKNSLDNTKLLPLIFLTFPYIWIAFVYVRFGLPSLNAPLNIESLQKGLLLILDSLSGVSFYQNIFGYINEIILIALRVFAAIVIIVATILFYKKRSILLSQKHSLFPLLFIPLILQFFITAQARAPWHSFSITVLVMILISIVLAVSLEESNRIYKLGLYALVLGTFVLYSSLHFVYHLGFTKPVIKQFSPENSELLTYTKNLQNSEVYSVTWGTHTQFIAFDPVRGKYRELVWDLENRDDEYIAVFLKGITSDSRTDYLVIIDSLSHPGNNLMQQIARVALANSYSLSLKQQILSGEEIIYEVYELQREETQ